MLEVPGDTAARPWRTYLKQQLLPLRTPSFMFTWASFPPAIAHFQKLEFDNRLIEQLISMVHVSLQCTDQPYKVLVLTLYTSAVRIKTEA